MKENKLCDIYESLIITCNLGHKWVKGVLVWAVFYVAIPVIKEKKYKAIEL